jgi:hypothetical protein
MMSDKGLTNDAHLEFVTKMNVHLRNDGDRLGCIHATIPTLFIFFVCAWLLIPSRLQFSCMVGVIW